MFHIGQKDIPLAAARGFLGKDAVIGLSTHSPEQVDAAIAASPRPQRRSTTSASGPVWATPTKPGRAAVGLDLVRYAAQAIGGADAERNRQGRRACVPWFAIGGIDLGNVEQVVDAGARRIVVVRAITEAADPAARRRSPAGGAGRRRILSRSAACDAGRH